MTCSIVCKTLMAQYSVGERVNAPQASLTFTLQYHPKGKSACRSSMLPSAIHRLSSLTPTSDDDYSPQTHSRPRRKPACHDGVVLAIVAVREHLPISSSWSSLTERFMRLRPRRGSPSEEKFMISASSLLMVIRPVWFAVCCEFL